MPGSITGSLTGANSVTYLPPSGQQVFSDNEFDIQMWGTYTGATVIAEYTRDGTNWFTLGVVDLAAQSVVNPAGGFALTNNSSVGWEAIRVNLAGLRLRMTGAIGSGSLSVLITSGIAPDGLTQLVVNNSSGASQTISSNSANALTVGPNGTTNPVFNVNAATANAVTGINVTGAASGAGVAVQVTSSNATEALTIDAKAGAAITLAGAAAAATGVNIGSSTSAANCVCTVTSSNATALLVGPNGATNPTLTVNCNTASAKTGLSLTAAAAGSGVALAATSNATNEALTLDAKGSGIVTIGSVSTGGCNVRVPVQTVAASGTAIGNAAAVVEGYTYVTGSNNSAAVKLPAGAIGMSVTLVNTVQTATLQVFPQASNAINNLANNAVYNIPNGGKRIFTYVASGQWYTDPQTIV